MNTTTIVEDDERVFLPREVMAQMLRHQVEFPESKMNEDDVEWIRHNCQSLVWISKSMTIAGFEDREEMTLFMIARSGVDR